MTNPLLPQDPHAPDEKLSGEAELTALYRQLPQNEPGPALDAAVLRAAAQALAPDEESAAAPRERRKAERKRGDWAHPRNPAPSTPAALPATGNRRKPRWLIALGSAATLVLAAGLAWHMRQAPAPESVSTAAESVAPAQATAAAAAPAPRRASAGAAMSPAEPAPPLLSEPARQPPPRMIVAQWRTPTTTASRKTAADKSAARASSEGYVTGGLARSAPSAPAASPTMLQGLVSDSAANAAKPAIAEVAPTPADIPTTAAPAPTPAAGMADEVSAPNASDTPAQELRKIEQLFAQHHDDEARQRLTAFQRAHPHWQLPPELRAQLRQP